MQLKLDSNDKAESFTDPIFYYSWDYGSLREVSPDLAGWYFFTFVVFGLFFLLNMFVAILNDSITEVSDFTLD